LSEITDRIDREIPRVDLHIHTSWTDGAHGVGEMFEQACRLNLEAVLFSEHARRTSIDWFGRFAREVRALPRESCLALVGVEAGVKNFKGDLDLDEEITSLCDLVMGSVHRFPGKNGTPLSFEEVSPDKALDTEFRLAEALLDNPGIHILGHPFGMCYAMFGRTPSKDMLARLMEKAARNNVAFEINSKYHPDPWALIRLCKDVGARISLGSDAHSRSRIGGIIQVLERERDK